MEPQAEMDKSCGLRKIFWEPPEPKILCQYKFYPTYLSTKAIQVKVEDIKCYEAASRFIAENSTEVNQRGLVG
ncbi:hypothetical protein RJT34_32271 [Clitoria ternatea]|uniref:Uncharacterized protein n=1 Tax=Clitoria ternatea TaxID=43366 RepID=A0AAN9EY00_CLITE